MKISDCRAFRPFKTVPGCRAYSHSDFLILRCGWSSVSISNIELAGFAQSAISSYIVHQASKVHQAVASQRVYQASKVHGTSRVNQASRIHQASKSLLPK